MSGVVVVSVAVIVIILLAVHCRSHHLCRSHTKIRSWKEKVSQSSSFLAVAYIYTAVEAEIKEEVSSRSSFVEFIHINTRTHVLLIPVLLVSPCLIKLCVQGRPLGGGASWGMFSVCQWTHRLWPVRWLRLVNGKYLLCFCLSSFLCSGGLVSQGELTPTKTGCLSNKEGKQHLSPVPGLMWFFGSCDPLSRIQTKTDEA